jgi:hypothetical protein
MTIVSINKSTNTRGKNINPALLAGGTTGDVWKDDDAKTQEIKTRQQESMMAVIRQMLGKKE